MRVCVRACVFSLCVRACACRLQQRVEQKESMESSLYCRFVMVLNQKKAKIRALRDSLQRLQHGGRDAADTDGHRSEVTRA